MKLRAPMPLAVITVVLLVGGPETAAAQPRAEIGGSLASVAIELETDDNFTVFGVPSATFGIFNPGVYASFFLGERAAIEPQFGLLVASGGGETNHLFTGSIQFDYFFSGIGKPSAYAFAGGGFTDTSNSSDTPKSVGGGLGWRIPVGDRLTFRVDGRYLHFTDNGGNALAFTLSIGGVFGQ